MRERALPAPDVPSGDDMVWIEGGEFWMGSNDHYPEESPAHRVAVGGFWIDRHQVTNERFARFVEATGFVTLAERAPDPAMYPGAAADDLVPGALVFFPTDGPVDLHDYSAWWRWIPGADWRHPTGPGSSLEGLGRHPVVHVAADDVEAFTAWEGTALPTEAEWEFAARGGLEGAAFTWGADDPQETAPKANTWQGRFPWENTEVDGWTRTAPVGSFEPNGYGLYDMAGNVWEWTADWYSGHHGGSPCCVPTDPRGGRLEESLDPRDAVPIPRRVLKGGSHLCAPSYCLRYRPAARQPQAIDTSMSHLGFRTVLRPNGARSSGGEHRRR
jgi:formylglycine-generating enzyme required for sulfatase activity